MILSFVLGPYVIFNTDIGQQLEGQLQEYYMFIIGFLLALPFEAVIQQQFIFEWVIYISIFTILAFTGKESLIKALRKSYKEDVTQLFNNNLLATISIFSITILLVYVIDIFQNQIGIPTGSLPETNPAKLLAYASHAPISEEIGFRLSIIGLFSLIIVQGWRFKIPIIEYLIAPIPTLRNSTNITDKKNELTKLFLPLIISSGLLFGFAHITPGSTWEIGKLSEATVAGIMFGIAYSYYGIGATILAHWGFNYYSNAIYIFEDQVSNFGISAFVDNNVLALGSIFILYYAIKFLAHRNR
jgi:membrane protease YdiL (CAAX protease family)